MKSLINRRSYAVQIDATGDVVEAGASVDIEDDELAASLLEQPENWAPASSAPKAKKEHSE